MQGPGKTHARCDAIGAPPNIAYTSATSLPYGVDGFAVAGGIAGEPVEMVKCKTIDLEYLGALRDRYRGRGGHRPARGVSFLRRIHWLHV